VLKAVDEFVRMREITRSVRVESGIPGQSGKPGHPGAETSNGTHGVLKSNFTYLFFSPGIAKLSDVSMCSIDIIVYELWAWH